MNDPLLAIGLAEVLLFFASFGLLWGGKDVGPMRKRIGTTIFAIWVIVLVIGVMWGIIRKFSS
jgi:uncharacterized membrane protein YozB (DUF420 family)